MSITKWIYSCFEGSETVNHAANTVGNADYLMGNLSLLTESVVSVAKGGAVAFGITLTGASFIDAWQAPTLPGTCLFAIGGTCNALGTLASAGVVLNNTVPFSPFGVLGQSVGTGCYTLGKYCNLGADRLEP